ncbi:NAD(P)/FAD-dependent oxidoreductase [Mycolicibacterium confluentis]|uniref:Pyridine nucleotide-disulfide oxidoreductase n=1 Tax=Mycolicibacterium confluentis TaxID=28047 RepID=A0A7I7Y3Y2_9MYCO|nr:NAD(P)/FAD-dependent oxidoreductase [Mycolicibacterium confluentis]MCV7322773.1 NAD(P)/FAD-dependent oxidoreductase [Mycolicibacterium confluentis]ORV29702.1 pyridine nucleotide-disulfide oxidoreductase [Mycolicibacterium confluentis]BBZ36319.1 pyridine nucleotide-disulfide oxidoreductase [Mycolicibacterium confluentis]
MRQEWECVVVGGGAAGLSAALVLGRARRQTLVVDAGAQSNSASAVMGGLLGFDRRPPADLYTQGRRELAVYPSVEYREGEVTGGTLSDDGVELDLEDGQRIRARRVLLTTGMQYCPPDLPGLAQFWGKSVFQCPFCHGWEMRDQRLAVMAVGEEAVHAALMLRGWSDDVVVLSDGPSSLDAEQARLLEAAGVAVDERRVTELIGADRDLTHVAFADGTRLRRDGLLVEAPLRQRSGLAEKLGVRCTSSALAPDAVNVDQLFRTDTPVVFAAGDVCAEQPHLAGAIATGSNAAMIVVQSLLADDFGLPYPPT